jgi:tripartite-type tricarboxylate transporter receptor subunit TctC
MAMSLQHCSLQTCPLHCVAGFIVALLCGVAPAGAQDTVEQFFRGKTVNIVVGSAVGGGFDGYARMLARHFGKYIPGNPLVVVQNLPGAGSNKAASFVALQAPKDGTTIGAIQPGAVLQPLVSDQPVPHDPSKFIMLGSGSYSVYLCMLRSDAPAKSFQEVLAKEVIIGTSGEGSTLREMPIMLTNVLGAKMRLVSGYAGSREVLIAIERNEVHGICGMGWSSIAMQQREWIRNGTLKIIAQEDLKGHPEVNKMGVPLTISFAKTEEDRQVMEMMYSQNLFGRPYVLPPEVPTERVAALRKAFMAALADKDLLAEAEKSGFDVGPMSGEEVQAVVAKLYALPPKVIERAKQSLIYKPRP